MCWPVSVAKVLRAPSPLLWKLDPCMDVCQPTHATMGVGTRVRCASYSLPEQGLQKCKEEVRGFCSVPHTCKGRTNSTVRPWHACHDVITHTGSSQLAGEIFWPAARSACAAYLQPHICPLHMSTVQSTVWKGTCVAQLELCMYPFEPVGGTFSGWHRRTRALLS